MSYTIGLVLLGPNGGWADDLNDYVAFNSYLTMIVAPVSSPSARIEHVSRGLASLKRLNALMVQPELKQFDRVDDGVTMAASTRLSYCIRTMGKARWWT